jgi:hypothetical protein
MGIAAPDPRVAWAILFGSYRGLFYGAPWLIAGVPGLVVLFRRGFRAEALASGTIVLAYVLLNAGLVDWHGGWAMGPRYLIPAIPFLAVGAMGLVRAWPEGSTARRALAWIGGAAAVLSAALMLAGTAVRPDVPLTIARPFQRFLIPSFVHGRVARSNHPIDGEGVSGRRAAWNLGHRLGLEGLPTLLPLAAWVGLCGWALAALLLLRRLPAVRLDGAVLAHVPGGRIAGRERRCDGLVDARLLVGAGGARVVLHSAIFRLALRGALLLDPQHRGHAPLRLNHGWLTRSGGPGSG